MDEHGILEGKSPIIILIESRIQNPFQRHVKHYFTYWLHLQMVSTTRIFWTLDVDVVILLLFSLK